MIVDDMTAQNGRREAAEMHRDTEAHDTRRYLRLLSVVIPLLGLAGAYLLSLALQHALPRVAVDVILGAMVTSGVVGFSWFVFRIIDRQDQHLARQHVELVARYETERRLRAQLEALHEASLALTSTRVTDQVLQRLVDLARDLVGARYAALGVLGPQRTIDGFYTSGSGAGGVLPQSLLGMLLASHGALRVPDVSRDPRFIGIALGDPPMRSLLGVPVARGEDIIGNLYLADETESEAFSAEDERLLTLLAAHAAVVIENARLSGQVRSLAVNAERNRISKDLHDGVIQSIYAVNLELENVADDVESAEMRERIDLAINRLGTVMEDVRRYIIGLQSENAPERALPEALAALLADARTTTLIEPHLSVKRTDNLPPELTQELVQVAREAITNVLRHAHAGHIWVTLDITAESAHLRIADNGRGFNPRQAAPPGHYGLRNLRERIAALRGVLTIDSTADQGTAIDVQVPLKVPQQEQNHA
jgi:signal transduction histidine kinase